MADAKLARCPRCKAHGLVAEGQGVRVAVDIAPVDALGFGVAVANGVGLWWVEKRPRGGLSVVGGYVPARRPLWGVGGAQAPVQGFGVLHAEHSCGAPARDMVILNIQAPKDSAPATPGAATDGNPRRAAPVAGAQAQASPSPAPTATRRLSDCATRCHDCRQLIDQETQPFLGIFHERWIWAVHEECE